MATKSLEKARKAAATSQRSQVQVCIGQAGLLVGDLTYARDGRREFSSFAYAPEWLAGERAFQVSPDLPLTAGHYVRKPPTRDDSCFFFALADTEPDTWGRRVIARAHAKDRKDNPQLGELTELDYLCAVDDFSRIGALRLRAGTGLYLRTADEGRRTTPPLFELEHMLNASRAVELGKESAGDLQYLQGKGTSLGGARPKCSVLDDDGILAIGKFPSVKDERSVTRGEVLALRLALEAGINAAQARVVMVNGQAVALVKRFDRTADDSRIAYMSGASLLQAERNEEHAYTEVVDQMMSACRNPVADAQQLWRRLAFNHLITNVDDHLQNIGFLYDGDGFWRIAPAFDLNPFPDKDRESKTWLSEDTGPLNSVEQLLSRAQFFRLDNLQAREVLGEVAAAVGRWRQVAGGPDVGMTASEMDEFELAFEHEELAKAKRLAT